MLGLQYPNYHLNINCLDYLTGAISEEDESLDTENPEVLTLKGLLENKQEELLKAQQDIARL